MNLKVLDCTLRDGGYVNNFNFGENTIKSILSSLYHSGIDFVECGFMRDDGCHLDKTLFPDLDSINKILPDNAQKKITFAMIKYGSFDVNKLPEYCEKYIKGFRVIFKKNQALSALNCIEILKNKGYSVCVNLTFIENYSNTEIIDFIGRVNKIKPYAFYFVDSTGSMTENRVKEVYKLIDFLLNKDIIIGFHSHNNMQLSFCNALEFIKCAQNDRTQKVCAQNMQGPEAKCRKIIIDTCTYGVGRGAGNLPSELLFDYLNKNYHKNYNIKFLFNIINNHLIDMRKKTPWGYSIEYFLSALYKCHPDYATYFKTVGSLSIHTLVDFFENMPTSSKEYFDEKYVENSFKENHCAKYLL